MDSALGRLPGTTIFVSVARVQAVVDQMELAASVLFVDISVFTAAWMSTEPRSCDPAATPRATRTVTRDSFAHLLFVDFPAPNR